MTRAPADAEPDARWDDATVLEHSPGIERAAIGEGVLLFDGARVRAHALNRSAAAIWDLVDGDTAAGVVERLGAVVTVAGGDGPALLDDVRRTVERLLDEGLIRVAGRADDATIGDADEDPTRRRGARPLPGVPYTDEPAPDGMDAVDWGTPSPTYTALGTSWRVITDDRELDRHLRHTLASLRADHPESAPGRPEVHDYRIVTNHGHDRAPRGVVCLDGHLVGRSTTDPQLVALALWHMNQIVSSDPFGATTGTHLLLHASAAVHPASGLVVALPAAMNAGKSTTVTALAAAGWHYVTDETLAVDITDLSVSPYPKAIALERGSWALFPHLAATAPVPGDRFSHGTWYLPPGDAGFRVARDRLRLAALAFVRHDPHIPTALTPFDSLDAAVALAQQSFNTDRLGRPGLDAIARLVTTVPCVSLAVSDLGPAVDLLGTLASAST